MNTYELVIIFESVLVVALGTGLFMARRKNMALTAALRDENKKRLVPILIFSVDGKSPALHLSNQGSCSAKDIQAEDTTLDLEYEFKRTITIHFDGIPLLNPHQSVPLDIKIYDRGHEVGERDKDYIMAKLTQGSFEARLRFSNMENVAYESVVVKEGGKFFIRETKMTVPQ